MPTQSRVDPMEDMTAKKSNGPLTLSLSVLLDRCQALRQPDPQLALGPKQSK